MSSDVRLGAGTIAVSPIAGRGSTGPLIDIPDMPGDLLLVELAPGSEPFNVAAPEWNDYSDRLYSVTVHRGRGIETSQHDVSSATFVMDNRDRALDSWHSTLGMNTPMRVSVVADSTVVQLWEGFLDGAGLSFGFPSLHDITAKGTDGLRYLARDEVDAHSWTDGDLTSVVITDYLDGLGWPAGKRSIDVGERGVDNNAAAFTYSGNGKEFVNLVVATEGPKAARFINRLGEFVFRNRSAIVTDTRSTTRQLTFTNLPNPAVDIAGFSGEFVRYESISAGLNAGTLYNKATVNRPIAGTTFTASDATSITDNGPLTVTHTGWYNDAVAPQADADELVALYKTAEPRITGLTTGQCDDNAAFKALVELELGDRVRVVHRMPGLGADVVGTPVDVDLIVEGFTYSISKGEGGSRFIADFRFADAAKFDALP